MVSKILSWNSCYKHAGNAELNQEVQTNDSFFSTTIMNYHATVFIM